MSKWTCTSRTGGGAEGILRGNPAEREREELLVFGYSCKLFRDDERAREVDQGRLLIPWQGDESLRIDRYDARGALHDLAPHEAPPGGYDWKLELTDAEKKVEQLCDDERYKALYCDEEEELMYKEEELKRLRAAGYGQIGFNYGTAEPNAPAKTESNDADEPYMPAPLLKALLPDGITMPETQKHAAIIEKTATFIAGQGAQMEILLRAKQAGNSQFDFLDKGCPLHQFYQIMIDAVKNNKLKDKEEAEEKLQDSEHYLHPSLATNTHVEAAPCIPSIHYKPSADCDYTMLISRFKGTRPEEAAEPAVPCGELAPPGTQPLALPNAHHAPDHSNRPAAHAQISRAPVLYTAHSVPEHQPTPCTHPPPQPPTVVVPPTDPPAASTYSTGTDSPAPAKSVGLNLMHYYNSGSESEHSGEEAEPAPEEPTPPEDVKVVIEKMAAYVARNGDEFEQIVKAKNDPRFAFLDPDHHYHTYYKRQMLSKRGVSMPPPAAIKTLPKKRERDDKKKTIAPVSFSIKKQKEPEAVLPKPALPYESSDEEGDENENGSGAKTTENSVPNPTPFPTPAPVEPLREPITYPIQMSKILKPETTAVEQKPEQVVYLAQPVTPKKVQEPEKRHSQKRTEEKAEKKEKKSKKERKERKENGVTKKKKRDQSRSKDKRRNGSRERSKSRLKDKEDKAKQVEMEKTITISESDDIMIDLTGDLSDSKGEAENGDRSKQDERKKRAAVFLASIGKDAVSVEPPDVLEDENTLASAMVKTLVELRAKKEAEEGRRRRRERQRRKHKKREEEKERSHRKSKKRKRGSSTEEGEYCDSSKRRKKQKRTTKKKKRRRSRSRSPESPNHSEAAADEPDKKEKSQPNVVVDPEVIKSKLKKLREESDEEFRAPIESPEIPAKKEYSEGEIASSDDKASCSDSAADD